MRLKSFTGPSVAAVMEQVRAELGDDAVILATHEDDMGVVRITAAVEPPEMPLRPELQRTQPDPAPARARTDDPAVALMERHGVPADLIRRLFARSRSGAGGTWPDLATRLERWLSYAPLGTASRRQVLMMVGPPGAGKTQAVAKLAARALLAGQKVGMLTTDTDRSAGIGGLAGFARALRLELVVADTPAVLADGLRSLTACDLAVVDSGGRNHLSAEEMAGLAGLVETAGVEPVLVLPAGLDPAEATDMAVAFGRIGARRMVITRLDTTRRLGSVIAAARQGGLALAEFSATPRIKDGLEPATPEALARFLSAFTIDHPVRKTGSDR